MGILGILGTPTASKIHRQFGFGNFGNFSETYCDLYCRNMEREKLPDPALHNGWRALFGVGGCGRYEFTERAGRESAERRSLII